MRAPDAGVIQLGGAAAPDLRGDPPPRAHERRVHAFFFACASLSILISVGIVLSLAGGTVDFLRKVDPGSLLSSEGWFPRRDFFDVRAILAGSIKVGAVAMLVATPLGLGAALFLSEYAGRRARRILKPTLETLASVPSVVMGFFALRFINPDLVQRFFPGAGLFSALGAGIAVGILVTPLVASVAEDALHAVPSALREASYGLGAKRVSTSLRVVVPAAVSGLTAALILGVSRAMGETMVVAIAAGGTAGTELNADLLAHTQTMTGAITSLATGSDQVRGATAAYPSLFFVGSFLFALTLALNLGAERFVRRARRMH